MKNELKIYQIAGILFTVILGTLLHFVYEWSGNRPIAALVSPINESVWEHLKLLLIPMLLFSVVEYFLLGKKYPNLVMANTVGLIIGLVTIVVLYYTYSGIIGTNFLILDILIFIFSTILAFYLGYRFTVNQKFSTFMPETGLAILFLIFAIFILFTFSPPIINLFKDPITDTYGILKSANKKLPTF